MENSAELKINGNTYKLPIVEGSEQERGIDISTLRNQTGCITLDDGYGNTGSCRSAVTFIDGEKGILRYRGIPIEELAEHSSFIEVAHLLIWGHLPTSAELRRFSDLLTQHELLHESMKHNFEGFPNTAHPMAILSSMINAAGCFDTDLFSSENPDGFQEQVARLISQVRTIAAFAHRQSRGLPIIYPNPEYKYTANFLHMMFSLPHKPYDLKPEIVKALDLILLLHADHEQNCSTSTVRMVASSKANLFASTAAGVCALWGPLHGGANQAVLEMLDDIHRSGDDGTRFINDAKNKSSGKKIDGLRPSRLQELRSARQDHQESLRRSPREAERGRSTAIHRQAPGRSRAARFLFRRAQVVSERGFLQRHHHARHRHSGGNVHRHFRHRPHAGVDRQL